MVIKVKSMNNKIGIKRYKINSNNKVCVVRVGNKTVGCVVKRRENKMELSIKEDKIRKNREKLLSNPNFQLGKSGLIKIVSKRGRILHNKDLEEQGCKID